MSALSEHVWGVSRAVDRVWAQVAGLRPYLADGRLLMVFQFQAFIDDSYKNGLYVLAGYVASAEAWAAFSRDWEPLLKPFGTLAKNGVYHFKMSEMAMNEERLARVQPFYRVIEEYALCALSCSIRVEEFRRAKARILTPAGSIQWIGLDSPFVYAFRVLMDRFHQNRQMIDAVVPMGQKIDFFFDKQHEESIIYAGWKDYLTNRSATIADRFGTTPRFEDDKEFLPLQAADLWAWWVRKWTGDGNLDALLKADFGIWKGDRKIPYIITIAPDEDQITAELAQIVKSKLEPWQIVIDAKSGRRF